MPEGDENKSIESLEIGEKIAVTRGGVERIYFQDGRISGRTNIVSVVPTAFGVFTQGGREVPVCGVEFEIVRVLDEEGLPIKCLMYTDRMLGDKFYLPAGFESWEWNYI
ncbi:MAG: hypothetical protein PHS44_04565 [Candidatus Dojkabacteria bacterium]|jgi:hypothetical protein|nr:hypothetical protein [Candidatus Dojkabacteria bacterium]